MKQQENSLVSIIIPSNNRCAYLRRCLYTIFCQTYKDIEVIVVDNGSNDDTAKMIETEYPAVRIVRNERNLGTIVSRNQGISISKGYYIWFLDSDVEVENQGCLEKIVEIIESDKQIGALGGDYVKTDIKMYIKKNFKVNLDTQSIIINKDARMVEVDFIATSNFFCKKNVLYQIGGFNPCFYQCDDKWISLCMRHHGYKLYIDTRIAVFHNICVGGRKGALFHRHKDRVVLYLLTARLINIILLPFYEIVALFDVTNISKIIINDIHLYKRIPESVGNNYFFNKSSIIRILYVFFAYVVSLASAYIIVLFKIPSIIVMRKRKNYNFIESSLPVHAVSFGTQRSRDDEKINLH